MQFTINLSSIDDITENQLDSLISKLKELNYQIEKRNDSIGFYEYWGFKSYDYKPDYFVLNHEEIIIYFILDKIYLSEKLNLFINDLIKELSFDNFKFIKDQMMIEDKIIKLQLKMELK